MLRLANNEIFETQPTQQQTELECETSSAAAVDTNAW